MTWGSMLLFIYLRLLLLDVSTIVYLTTSLLVVTEGKAKTKISNYRINCSYSLSLGIISSDPGRCYSGKG